MWEYGGGARGGGGRGRFSRTGMKVEKKAVALKQKVSAKREIQVHFSYWTLLFNFK